MVRFVFISSFFIAAVFATTTPAGGKLAPRQLGFSAVTTSYRNLQSHFQSANTRFATNGFTLQSARSEVQQLYSEFNGALTSFNTCAACIATGNFGTFSPLFMSTLSSFNTLYQTSSRVFGASQALDLFGGFGRLDSAFDQSFHRIVNAGAALNTFVPGRFSSFFNQLHLTHSASYLGQFRL
ncbi:hypothetical protein PTTG_12230 [Puccinia triticina 1-1 BBBD Race 1]|uniref:Uncharacterized protein n=2 Tax=Puccinia triticina TaxID=208348 RepID=A0A180GU94_PUCT1|nr:uncharacterized protein PtA15_11A430 [Puccinia triticina]OAV95872.1 hypothetical protein PTTG_12230 [Puccinia triticina 1-1 BBBD Race 1]WAQ89739.1 hypothetical protein PtA15_11A430 [Puccinia triticina]WAR59788.1 hypothetical protein PtB15_11B429 [Puccinia triticina]